jgi:hypothetical protein
MNIETVLRAIAQTGLLPRGAMRLDDSERDGTLTDVRTIVLVGMAGRVGWGAFAASAEARDGLDHPLDRWTRRVIDALAADLGALALYPFGGPPFLPFQQWARRCEPVHPSPIGLLIHPAYGLWHSYRGAIGFSQAIDVAAFAPSASPCESCQARPCLAARPVGAFTTSGYDVAACVGHLKSDAGAECMIGGCLARRACPIGAERAHGAKQAAFTMQAFLRARTGP